jgi:hypothetical protein
MTRLAYESEAVEVYDAFYFEHFEDEVKRMLEIEFDIRSLYEINEGGEVTFVSLEECIFCYDGLEHLYTDEAYSFIIYFSHEDSATLGGEKLIAGFRRIWPEHRNHLWVDPIATLPRIPLP